MYVCVCMCVCSVTIATTTTTTSIEYCLRLYIEIFPLFQWNYVIPSSLVSFWYIYFSKLSSKLPIYQPACCWYWLWYGIKIVATTIFRFSTRCESKIGNISTWFTNQVKSSFLPSCFPSLNSKNMKYLPMCWDSDGVHNQSSVIGCRKFK